MKKRIIISLLLCFFLVLLLSILSQWVFYQSQTFEWKFEQIKIGMTEADVENRLGTPDAELSGFRGLWWISVKQEDREKSIKVKKKLWQGDQHGGIVEFDAQGKVVFKELWYVGTRE